MLLVYLEQSEPHPNAIPRALSERQETVRTSLGFLFRTEVIRIEFLRIAEVLLVFHEFWTALEKKTYCYVLCYVITSRRLYYFNRLFLLPCDLNDHSFGDNKIDVGNFVIFDAKPLDEGHRVNSQRFIHNLKIKQNFIISEFSYK